MLALPLAFLMFRLNSLLVGFGYKIPSTKFSSSIFVDCTICNPIDGAFAADHPEYQLAKSMFSAPTG